MSQRAYGPEFMGVTAQSRYSAERIVRCVQDVLPVASVVDFGCALGTWLSVWQAGGVADLQGVDGDYLRGQRLEIDPDIIRFHDLAGPIDLSRRYDLVQSLEVAEHLPQAAASTFVTTLTRHGDVVLFSAAPPGQGGEHHTNEQPYEYWRDLFAACGFVMVDWIRPRIAGDTAIRYWYRYNIFMFVRETAMGRMPAQMVSARVPASGAVADISPMLFKLRKRAVRKLPPKLQDRIAGALAKIRGAG